MTTALLVKLMSKFPFAYFKYRRWQSRPLQAIFQVTHNCPARCEYCNAWATRMPNLSMEEIDIILKKLERMGVLQLAITGGEPLLRKDIGRIVQQGTQRGMLVTVITSGLIGSEELFLSLMQNGLAVLAFSLDGANKETHEEFRRGTSFAKVIDCIKMAVRIRNQHGFSTRINTSTVIHRNSLPELERIAALTQELGVDHASYQPVWAIKDDTDFIEKFGFAHTDQLLLEQARDTILGIPNANLKEYVQLLPDFYARYEKIQEEIQCFAGRAYVFVDYKGDLYPCTTWAKSFGSLLREEPATLLEGDRAKQIFVEAADQKVCGGCSLTCHQERNIMLNKFSKPTVFLEMLLKRFSPQAKRKTTRELPVLPSER